MRTEYRYAKPEHEEIVNLAMKNLHFIVESQKKIGYRLEEIIESPEYRKALHLAVDLKMLYQLPVYVLEKGESVDVEA